MLTVIFPTSCIFIHCIIQTKPGLRETRVYHQSSQGSMTASKRLLKPKRKFVPLVSLCAPNTVHKMTFPDTSIKQEGKSAALTFSPCSKCAQKLLWLSCYHRSNYKVWKPLQYPSRNSFQPTYLLLFLLSPHLIITSDHALFPETLYLPLLLFAQEEHPGLPVLCKSKHTCRDIFQLELKC